MFSYSNMSNHGPNKGFSLIEILIALALGSLLFLGLTQVYLSSKHLYGTAEANARWQENVRFASNTLFTNITMAGYSGCANLQDAKLFNNTNFSFNVANSVLGYEATDVPSYLHGAVIPNTDVIVIQKAGADENYIAVRDVKIGDYDFYAALQNPATKDNRILFLGDCQNADLFETKDYIGSKITSRSKIQHQYIAKLDNSAKDAAKVSRFEEIAYFISDTGRVDDKGQPVYGLYMKTNRGDKQELAEDIDMMKIKYFVNGQYYTAAQVSSGHAWNKVQSVYITLGSKMHKWYVYIRLRERSV
jgi:prepilin-type N-terminal cleavage/methylation domain-containing protein